MDNNQEPPTENHVPRDFDKDTDFMKGLYVRNTFLDFSEESDPWMIGPSAALRRQHTDSVLDRNSSFRTTEPEDMPSSATSSKPRQFYPDFAGKMMIPQMPIPGIDDFATAPMTMGVDQAPYERSDEEDDDDREEGDGEEEDNQETSELDEQKGSQVSPEIEAMRQIALDGGGLSGCTTVMMRQVPSKYTQRKLLREINSSGFMGQYDYMYLPMDPRSHANRGFAFINLLSPEVAEEFYKKFHGQYLRHFSAEKPIAVLPADLQGFAENALRYAVIASAHRGKRTGHTKPIFFRPLPPHIAAKVNGNMGPDSTAAQQNTGPVLRRPPERSMYPQQDSQEMASAMLQQAMMRSNCLSRFLISEETPMQPQPLVSLPYRNQDAASVSAKRQGANFCVYCGHKRLPEHLFCPYCGRQFQS